MNLLMAVSDIVLMVTQIKYGMDMPHTKQPLSPNRQLPVISVTPTNTALVQQLRMSLIARAIMYTGVSRRKTGLRKNATHTRMLPSKAAMAITVQEKDSITICTTLRDGSSNDCIIRQIVFIFPLRLYKEMKKK